MAAKKIKICLDAGHYGKYNRSPHHAGYYESEIVWKLHLLEKHYLEQYGFTVVTTRADQKTDLDVISRGKKAKGCDLLISEHTNASGNIAVDRVTIFHLHADAAVACDDVSKAIAHKIAPVMSDVMGVPNLITSKRASYDRNDDGALNDNYYGILHGARLVGVPALLIENSFHTNPRMTSWLMDDYNLDRLAIEKAAAIAAYFGQNAPAKPTAPSNSFTPYLVKVLDDELNIRKTPKWGDEDIVGKITDHGVYTIVDETMVEGTRFGLLKTGKVKRNKWISVEPKYVEKR